MRLGSDGGDAAAYAPYTFSIMLPDPKGATKLVLHHRFACPKTDAGPSSLPAYVVSVIGATGMTAKFTTTCAAGLVEDAVKLPESTEGRYALFVQARHGGARPCNYPFSEAVVPYELGGFRYEP